MLGPRQTLGESQLMRAQPWGSASGAETTRAVVGVSPLLRFDAGQAAR